MCKRKTLLKEIEYEGIGLHKGEKIKMKLIPAKSKTGIIFKRVDLPENNEITLDINNLFDLNRGTNLQNEFGANIFTVEHFLSSLYIFGITDLIVEVDGNEMPIGDGSSHNFVETIDKVGVKEYDELADVIEINTPIYVSNGDKHIVGLPYDGYKITYAVNYNHSFLKSQLAEYEINKENFINLIGNARTFGFDYEVEYLKKNNLALGGSLDNAIVVGKDGVLNPEGLRYEDEFVRHKILDLIGDLKVLNKNIKGHIIAIKAGHAIDALFAKELHKKYGGDS
ncbi:MAG: UDP-3-O-[3-hydroxymyristoyl] N-acetylglucosamine deacetylase [Fusobacteria bacterium]|jgi:UDP-3-O-[3-hydroxymyristoyl] N-acetylglucosamine deacetylase|nr:UDP-3-O-[3-hydroxymyristoyl] N-acetylglucosamine deacetylase [Fusobacteriota bacterium]